MQELEHFKNESQKIGSKQLYELDCIGYKFEQNENNTEYWISEKLNDFIMIKKKNSNQEEIFRITDVNIASPDDSLFDVPDFYELESL